MEVFALPREDSYIIDLVHTADTCLLGKSLGAVNICGCQSVNCAAGWGPLVSEIAHKGSMPVLLKHCCPLELPGRVKKIPMPRLYPTPYIRISKMEPKQCF